MKKIALLTFHYANNYGALLQTIATVEYLKAIGNKVSIINLVRRPQNRAVTFVYSAIANYQFSLFRKQYFKNVLTDKIYPDDDLSILNRNFDVFISGSDQIWRTKHTVPFFGYRYFLDFVNKKKISYASSFGTNEWIEDESSSRKISECLKTFHAISVREDSGIELCKNILGVDAIKVVDPTLLQPLDFYLKIAENGKHRLPNKYLSVFFLEANKKNELSEIKKYSKANSSSFIDLTIPKIKFGNKKLDAFPRSIEKWLYVLLNSECIITESFHCVVFALIFRKKFVCILNKNRGVARIESLLGGLGLTHLMVTPQDFTDQFMAKSLSHNIDYERVWTLLDAEIEKSKKFIIENV